MTQVDIACTDLDAAIAFYADLGFRHDMIMPADAPRLKLENTRALGADVVLYDRYRENRESVAARVLAERARQQLHRQQGQHRSCGEPERRRQQRLDLLHQQVGDQGARRLRRAPRIVGVEATSSG